MTSTETCKNMFLWRRILCCFKSVFFVFWWPLLSIFNARFDCLNQIDTLNDHKK